MMIHIKGEMPEWLKGAGCKPVGFRLRRFESYSLHQKPHHRKKVIKKAEVAQLAEYQPSKLRVAGSRPVFRSNVLYSLKTPLCP